MDKTDCTKCEEYKDGHCENIRSEFNNKQRGLGDSCIYFWDKEYNPLNIGKEKEMDKKEMVNHPTHYNKGSIEVIDFIEDQKLGFHLGNAIKYISRASNKGGVEDIKKAIWYLQRQVDRGHTNE